jgi:anthranilate synthase/aminodeoxychorismate synthase-like glutamine amidotransferase
MILVIDNYDSFTYNLVQYLGELGRDSIVFRNDTFTMKQIDNLSPSHIVISPGPRTPLEAGLSNEVVARFRGIIPILGVCLGHQCIGFVYGGRIVRAIVPMHGKQSLIYHDSKTIFNDLPNPLLGGRYHSLVVATQNLPQTLEISAKTAEGEIMGLRDTKGMVEGIQIHPESILTPRGHEILTNFLKLYQRK